MRRSGSSGKDLPAKPVNHTRVSVECQYIHVDYMGCHAAEVIPDNNVTVNIICRAIKRAQMPAVKKPVSLIRQDNKSPGGTTLLPLAREKSMAWDVSVPRHVC